MLYYTILYYTMIYYPIVSYTILYYTIPDSTFQISDAHKAEGSKEDVKAKEAASIHARYSGASRGQRERSERAQR